jgi:hypothetical protein
MLFTFGASALCLAQRDTATILGTVLDSSGAVIPGAKVVVENMGTSAAQTLVTDQTGGFIVPVLPVGTYRVTASATGFKTYVQENIRLSFADRINLSISLAPGAVTEQVTVVGEAGLVQTATTTQGGVLGTNIVEDLPVNGRGATQLMAVIPGMILLGGSPVINGASDGRIQQAGIKYVVDGGDSGTIDMDVGGCSYWSSSRVTKISEDAIQEVNMVTDSYSAEFGQTTGGLINFISKSGTNEYHGSLFEFFRNDILDARNYFNPAPFPKPAYRLNQFGGTLGGPIKRGKLFFFGDYEGVRQRTGVSLVGFVPTQAFRNSLASVLQPVVGMLPLPNAGASSDPRLGVYDVSHSNVLTEDTWTGKVDYDISPKDRLSFRSTGDRSLTTSYFGVATAQFRTVPYNPQTARIGYTRTISPTLINEAAFYVNRLYTVVSDAGTAAVQAFPQTLLGSGTAMVGPADWGLVVGNASFTWMDSLSWVKGRHQLKFGAQIERQWDNKQTDFEQYMVFTTLDDFAANKPFSLRTEGWPMAGMRGTSNNFFVQDDFRLSKHLTLNMGLRYQYDTVAKESHGRMANFNFVTGTLDPTGTAISNMPKLNFAPRFGFAYSPFTSNRTVIRGGFGLLYTSMQYSLPQWLPANVKGVGEDWEVTSIDEPSLVGFPVPDITGRGVPVLQAMDRDWKTPYTEQWSLNVQREFGQSNMLQVGYLGNRTLHLIPGYGDQLNTYVPGTSERIYPNFGAITSQTTCCIANYNALQVSFKRRLAKGLSLGAHYTWSHALDEATLISSAAFQDPFNPRADYGSADYDARHNLVFYYDYHVPAMPHVWSWLGNGWQINGITSMRSGFPVDVLCGCDTGGLGTYTGRPNLVPGVPLRPANYSLPYNQINIAAFTTPATGTFGNAGRNIARGPSAYNWDFSIFKHFQVREKQSLEFRFETFNIFNTPQFSVPQANTSAPATFGGSFSTDSTLMLFGTQRQIQFGLKYVF